MSRQAAELRFLGRLLPVTIRGLASSLLVIVALALPAPARAGWCESYFQGRDLVRRNATEAVRNLRRAADLEPEESAHKRTGSCRLGSRGFDYFPHYHLAFALRYTGQTRAALQAIRESLSQGRLTPNLEQLALNLQAQLEQELAHGTKGPASTRSMPAAIGVHGACCRAAGCEDGVDELLCADAFHAGETCATACPPPPAPPPEPTGACCVGGSCQPMRADECAIAEGTYLGDDEPCSTSRCVMESPSMGACCIESECSEGLFMAACEHEGGYFYGPSTTCELKKCPVDGETKIEYHGRPVLDRPETARPPVTVERTVERPIDHDRPVGVAERSLEGLDELLERPVTRPEPPDDPSPLPEPPENAVHDPVVEREIPPREVEPRSWDRSDPHEELARLEVLLFESAAGDFQMRYGNAHDELARLAESPDAPAQVVAEARILAALTAWSLARVQTDLEARWMEGARMHALKARDAGVVPEGLSPTRFNPRFQEWYREIAAGY